MTTPNSEISIIDVLTKHEDQAAKCANVLNALTALDPAKVKCLMVVSVVSTSDNLEEGPHLVSCAIIGSDGEITKMLLTAAHVAKNGITTANNQPEPPPASEVN